MSTNGDRLQISTFYIGENLYGMDISHVQEINKHGDITCVAGAPEYVPGVINLRGRIVTVIDLGLKFGADAVTRGGDERTIIIDSKGEFIGLLVERIWDVVYAEEEELETPPANMGGINGKFFRGVLQLENELVGVLDVEQVLAHDSEMD